MNATMIIECPNCGTKYKVIEEAVRPRGRTVQCTQCRNKWHVEPSISAIDEWEERFKPDPIVSPVEAFEEPPAEEIADEDEKATVSERFPAPPPEAEITPEPESPFVAGAPHIVSEPDQGHGSKMASFGLLAASVVLLLGGVATLRGPIERLWPASGRLYQVVGVESSSVPGQGLELKDVHAYLVTEGTGQTLTIEAKVVNPQKTSLAVPSLSATLVSPTGQARHWTFDAGTTKLEPAAVASAKASFDGANTENGKILLTFSADNGVAVK